MKIRSSLLASRKRTAPFLAAVLVAASVAMLPACAGRKEFQRGYEAGAANTVKRQYWILQNLQKADESKASRPRLSVYRLPVEPDPHAAVKTVPYEIAVPIYE